MRPEGTIDKRAFVAQRSPSARGNRGGQVLLIAVLLMTAILLVGILFVALVSRNQEQSSRHVDVVTAQALAEAGVRYADRMLQTSPQGADWRPHFVPYVDPATPDPNFPPYNADDPATWPSPPAMYESGEYDPGFWGLDGIQGSDDDYYSDYDIMHNYHALRAGSIAAPGEYLRTGFSRYPDPIPGGVFGGAAVGPNNVNFGRGYVLLRLTYDPDPPFEPDDPANPTQVNLSNCIKIEAVGRVNDMSTVARRLVAYKPIGLTDHLRWVTDGSGTGKRAYLGLRPEIDFNRSATAEASLGQTDATDETIESIFGGPIRANTAAYLVGQPDASGRPSMRIALQTNPSTDGYMRTDSAEASQGFYMMDSVADGANVEVDGVDEGNMPVSLTASDTTTIPRVATGHRDVRPLDAPDIAAEDPTTGMDRYRVLTRDSGTFIYNSVSSIAVNTGRFGWGAGVYIDNFGDIQFKNDEGDSDLALLVQDWRKEYKDLGALAGETGWNALGTTYTPAGVEIEFFPSEAAVLATANPSDPSDPDYSTIAPTNPGVLWWPNHVPGEPGIKITRHDHRWAIADAAAPIDVGTDSGENVMVIDYPAYPNQVIFAEGNIRVRGTLPAAYHDPATPDAIARDYNMTVVSNATIYIDGQILTPQDVDGRRIDIDAPEADGVLDEDNTGVALLAHDSVCLNPTQLVPQMMTPGVAAAPDNDMSPELGHHWELDSNKRLYTRWMFGEDLPANVAARLTVQQTGGSPGPSGCGLVLDYDGNPNPPQAYDFGNPVDPYTFVFAPSGALLWGSIPTPNAYTSTAIGPQWQSPVLSYGPYRGVTLPAVPWNLGGYISRDAGTQNAAALFYRDPRLGPPASEYWVRKWKIEEIDTDIDRPRGAINAKVSALIYAQRGSWFVIPGAYFDENTYTTDFNGDGQIDAEDSVWAARMRRYNYRITVRGCITEDHTAQIEDVQDWTNKWAFPIYADADTLSWGSIEYEFDERLRIARHQGQTTLDTATNTRRTAQQVYTPQANLPKLPLLPVSPTLLYYGEAF